ncbi:MAG: hypothetical protein AAF497_09160, partial [Planctomycetota bacterium]
TDLEIPASLGVTDLVNLSVEVAANRMRVFVNGVALVSASGEEWTQHQAYPSIGRVGITSLSASTSSATFKDFRLVNNAVTSRSYSDVGYLEQRTDTYGTTQYLERDTLGRTLANRTSVTQTDDVFANYESGDLSTSWSNAGNWDVSDGNLIAVDPSSASGQTIISEAAPSIPQYTIKAEISTTGTNDFISSQPSVLFRRQTNSTERSLARLSQENGVWGVEVITRHFDRYGQQKVDSDFLSGSSTYVPGLQVVLEVQVDENRTSIILDGQRLATDDGDHWVEQSYLQEIGSVGLSLTTAGSATAEFSNFKLAENPTSHASYDAMGRVISSSDALGVSSFRKFDLQGRLLSEQTQLTTNLEDFSTYSTSDIASRWDGPASNNAELANGRLFWPQSESTVGKNITLVDAPSSKTYGVEARFRMGANNFENGNPNIRLRIQDGNSAYSSALLSEIDGRYAVIVYSKIKQPDSSFQTVNETPFYLPQNFEVAAGDTVEMTIWANGEHLAVSIDGIPLSLSSTSYRPGWATHQIFATPGKVGLGVTASLMATDSNPEFQSFRLMDLPTWQYSYDSTDNLAQIVDPLGQVTTSDYDARNRMIERTYADGAVDKWTYDAAGQLTLTEDALGRQSIVSYDDRGRAIAVTDAEGNVSLSEFNSFNDLTKSYSPHSENTFGFGGKSVETVVGQWPGFNSADWQIDNEGIQLTEAATKFLYSGSPFSRTRNTITAHFTSTDVVNSEPGIVLNDDAGTLSVAIFRQRNDRWEVLLKILQDDGSGMTEVSSARQTFYLPEDWTLPENVSLTMAVNATSVAFLVNGQMLSVNQDANQPDWQAQALLPNGDVRVAYRIKGGNGWATKLKEFAVAELREDTFSYDRMGRLVQSQINTQAATTEQLQTKLTYDTSGNLIVTESVDMADTNAPQPDSRRTSYIYDSWSQPVRTVDAAGFAAESTYDLLGRVATVADGLGRKTHFEYDTLGRIVSATAPDPDGTAGPLVAPAARNTYDARGSLVSTIDQVDRISTYQYDDFARLVSATSPDPDDDGPLPAIQQVSVYDFIGNLVVEQVTSDDRNVVTQYEYDDRYRQTKITEDADGADQRTTEFEYDLVGNLTKSTIADAIVSKSTYDDLNRITRSVISSATAAGPIEFDLSTDLITT